MSEGLPSRHKAQALEVSTSTRKRTEPHSLIVTASERLGRTAAVVTAQRAREEGKAWSCGSVGEHLPSLCEALEPREASGSQ